MDSKAHPLGPLGGVAVQPPFYVDAREIAAVAIAWLLLFFAFAFAGM
jgi:hypothetical protein